MIKKIDNIGYYHVIIQERGYGMSKKYLATWSISEERLDDINFHLKLWQELNSVYDLPKNDSMTIYEKASVIDYLSWELLAEHQYSNYADIYESLIHWAFPDPKVISRQLGRIKYEIEIINPENFATIMILYIRYSPKKFTEEQIKEYCSLSREAHKTEC